MLRVQRFSSGAQRSVLSTSSSAVLVVASQRSSSTFDGVMVQRGRSVDPAPRAEQDFVLPPATSSNNKEKVVPGAHPLPLSNDFVSKSTWPLISPYMPSPHRAHPYWTESPEELLCLDPSIPNLFGHGIMTTPIVVPVFDCSIAAAGGGGENGGGAAGGGGKITHTRKLSNFIFGTFPRVEMINYSHTYWICRNHNMADQWDFQMAEINRRAKKNWANTGTGMGRVSQRKDGKYPWGAQGRPGIKPWTKKMPAMDPIVWQTSNRHMLTLKLLQGKLQIVKDLDIAEPTTACFQDLCDRMKWDIRHDGGGVLFMDGGSRLAPSLEFNNNFFYGSFHNGRNKLVRPTIMCEESVNSLRHRGTHPEFLGPQGAQNPIPINRFNTYDALEHHLLVITEGALHQIEQEIFPVMYETLPPHIRQQLPDLMDPTTNNLFQGSPLMGDMPLPLSTIEAEVHGRLEENEKEMYAPFYDNPYKPWADEKDAAYYVNSVDGYITRHVRAANSESSADAAAAAKTSGDGSPTPLGGSSDSSLDNGEQAWTDGSWRVLE